MKYNVTFIVYDPLTEIRIEAGLRGDGYAVQRTGRKLTVIGINEEWRSIIEQYANRLWQF